MIMGILNETYSALAVEWSTADTVAKRIEKETIGARVYDLIQEADQFMAGVRAYAEEIDRQRG
jgi:hypothetical protein